MIRTLAITKDLKPIYNVSLDDLSKEDIMWYWMDFNSPSQEETAILESHFHFHHLAIEDCMSSLNNPKLDYYDKYNFFVLNALNKDSLDPVEVCLFVSDKYVVSYHSDELKELDEAWERAKINEKSWDKGTTYIVHQVLDKIVDYFFPAILKIEERLSDVESNVEGKAIPKLMDEVFEIRGSLLKLRKTVNFMRDLLYRILKLRDLKDFKNINYIFQIYMIT